jgi:hypothetical protein
MDVSHLSWHYLLDLECCRRLVIWGRQRTEQEQGISPQTDTMKTENPSKPYRHYPLSVAPGST